MAFNRVGRIEFVPTTNATAKSELTLADIDDQLIEEIEEMYAQQKRTPGGRFRLTFQTKSDMLQYLAQAVAYAKLRVEGPIRVRRSPTPEKSLKEAGLSADTTMDIRVTEVPEPKTEEIRQATAAANEPLIATPETTKATTRGRRK